MRDNQKFIPLGGIDSDTDVTILKESDYVDAKNCRHITESTESQQAYIPIKGNKQSVSISPVTGHAKRYRVFHLIVPPTPREITLYNTNGSILFTTTWVDGATVDITSTNFQTAVGASLTANNQTYTFFHTLGNDYTDFEVRTASTESGVATGWEYTIASTGINEFTFIIIQEAISVDITGVLIPIGSSDLLGDLFIWSTTQSNFPTIIDAVIINTTNNGAGRIRVQTNISHGLVDGEEIIISDSDATSTIVQTIIAIANNGSGAMRITTSAPHGFTVGTVIKITIAGAAAASNANGIWYATVSGASTLDLQNSTFTATSATGSITVHSNSDGTWIINVIDATHFDLINSIFTIPSTTGNITRWPKGFGEIGVQTYDANTDTFTYTRLIRSKEFNFVTKKQIKTFTERTNLTNNLYWVDDYNLPRVLYYRGPYITDGALNYINPNGQYSYGTIGEETKLFIGNTNITLDFFNQIQSGGALKAGNWRYAVRFLTEGLSATEWTDLSNPINVYFESTSQTPSQLSGDGSNAVTQKINQLKVTRITPGLFKFIELAAVWYADLAIIGYVVVRIQLTNDQTEITINHTGEETGTTILDLGTLNIRQLPYITAQNIDAIDNRLILSNLTTRQIGDLISWTSTFSHSIKQGTVQGNRPASGTTYRFGEYFDPQNVFRKIGYMQNEVYRMGVKGRFKKTGELSPVFWIDDIKIDTSATNISTPNRRISGLPNWNLTEINGGTDLVYEPYIEFSNINLDFLIDGIRIRDIFEELIFERAEVVPEILMTGAAILSFDGIITNGTGQLFRSTPIPAGSVMAAYPFVSGIMDNVATATPLYTSIGANARRDIIKVYSPDFFTTGLTPLFSNGDEIINFGNQQFASADPANTYASGGFYGNSIVEYNGYVDTSVTSITPEARTIVDFKTAGTEQTGISIGGGSYNQRIQDNLIPNEFVNKIGFLFDVGLANGFTNVSVNADYGFYYIQYRKVLPAYTTPDLSKYGDRINTKYIPTGTSYLIEDNSPSIIGSGIISVFGGDSMTQKFFIKDRVTTAASGTVGGNGGLGFYSQNRTNVQMIYKYDNQSTRVWTYPRIAATTWLTESATLGTDKAIYNQGYTPRNGVNLDSAFDNTIQEQTDFRTRIIYSEIKPANSFVDNYRIFLPLNFKDLDPTFGKITHHANLNGELYTWQQRAFMRQYFNQRGTMDISDGTQVLIGNGSVFGQDGQTLSVIGCKHVWGVVKGKTPQGNDMATWINTELKKYMRFGGGETQSVADVKGMQSWFANNLKWVDLYDTPADGQGLHGVWDDRNAEVVFVIRAKKIVSDTWNSVTTYFAGDIVAFIPTVFSTFNRTGEVYIALTNAGTNVNKQPDLFPLFWQVIPHTNNNYYNEWSLVFSEFKQKFTAFFTPLPKIFLKWTDTYFSSRPVIDINSKIYLHNSGLYLSWYQGSGLGDVLQEVGFIEAVINKFPDESKWAEAIRIDSDITPFRLDFKTKTQISFLTSGELEGYEDYYESSIKEDSTISLVNDGDTSLLYGKWLKVKFTFNILEYQRMGSWIVKFRISPRVSGK